MAAGHYEELIKNENSLTGKYLSGQLVIIQKQLARKVIDKITITGCRQNNLKDIDVSIPLQMLTVVTGVSGSGKTTLIKQTLYPALQKFFNTGNEKPGLFKSLDGNLKSITGVEMVDQNPIGKSSRSNPVTYVKVWDEIRKLYAKQQYAKLNGFAEKHFSFNTDGGRCDTCKGEGEVVVEMQFLADVHLICESCKGKRFKDEVLNVKYKGKNVYDVLSLSVDEAIGFFAEEKKIILGLGALSNVGLGYIKLGQSSDLA